MRANTPRGGLISKIHGVVDTNGVPIRLCLTAGEAHYNRGSQASFNLACSLDHVAGRPLL